MAADPTTLERAAERLAQSLSAGPAAPGWQWSVRQRLAEARAALHAEYLRTGEGWLAARAGGLFRERGCLLRRLTEAGRLTSEAPDLDAVRAPLLRLASDLGHHAQRIHDLAYDTVALELGGSE